MDTYFKQVILPLTMTIFITTIITFAIMLFDGGNLNSALTTTVSITLGIIAAPAVLWLIAVSFGYRKVKNNSYHRTILHISAACAASTIWFAIIYLITQPNIDQSGFGSLAIIIVASFSILFTAANTAVSLTCHHNQKHRLSKQK